MRWVLGFDGGGTKTDCVLMDESGAVVARARSGASNPTSFGVEVSLASLAEAAKDALRTAGRSEKDVAYVVAGVSGAGEPSMRWALQSGLQPGFPNATILITSDLVLSDRKIREGCGVCRGGRLGRRRAEHALGPAIGTAAGISERDDSDHERSCAFRSEDPRRMWRMSWRASRAPESRACAGPCNRDCSRDFRTRRF